jgi:hypothetical protein
MAAIMTRRGYIGTLILLLASSLGMSACASWRIVNVNAAGWKQVPRSRDYIQEGEFVLINGQATRNGEISIKLAGISNDTSDSGTESGGNSAILEFFTVQDQQLICRASLPESSTSYDLQQVCHSELPINNLDVFAVDAWTGRAYIRVGNLHPKF